LVPVLVDDDFTLSQSLAILEYIDESYPSPPLLYGSAKDKAFIRQMAYIIACEVHPLNNLRVWKGYVGGVLGAQEDELSKWYSHWILEGLKSYERLLLSSQSSGNYSCGDRISMADLCLIPQLYNARRFSVPLDEFPLIRKIELNCIQHEAFVRAAPESQSHAPSDIEPIHGPNAPLLKEAA
jgi:maleylacetoacetate isomerase